MKPTFIWHEQTITHILWTNNGCVHIPEIVEGPKIVVNVQASDQIVEGFTNKIELLRSCSFTDHGNLALSTQDGRLLPLKLLLSKIFLKEENPAPSVFHLQASCLRVEHASMLFWKPIRLNHFV